MPAVEAAESQKSHKEHQQKKDMFSCSDCDKKFSQNKLLKNHIKTRHTKNMSDEKKIVCKMCKAEFTDEHDIKVALVQV